MNKHLHYGQQQAKKALEIDWDKHIKVKNDQSFFNNKCLLSVSTLLSGLNKVKFANVPAQYLEMAAQDGKDVMVYLEYLWKEHVTYDIALKLEYPNPKIKSMVLAIYKFLADNRFKVIAFEKHISNGFWHGYIDLVVRDLDRQLTSLIEVKTRNKSEVYDTDRLQVAVYGRMLTKKGLPLWVLVINKNNMQITFEQVRLDTKLITIANQFISKFLSKDYQI